MGLHVRATMTMPPHHHQIRVQKTHSKGVKAPALPEAGKKDKILHSRTPPKNGCFTVNFHCTVAIHNTVDWDRRLRSDVAEDRRMLAEGITESFVDCGQSIKRSLSDHAPASIDCAVIISNIYDVTDDLHHGEPMMGVPICGYVATSTRVHRKVWEESNTLCDVFGTPLNWTKITDSDHWRNSLLARIQI
jgi:hypothetical protein